MTRPESLLSTATSLRDALVASLGPRGGRRAHALSQVAPSDVDHLRAHLANTVSTLESSLAAFEQLLPVQAEPDTRPANLDKFLSLLSQSAATEHSLLSLAATSRSTTATASTSTSSYPTLHPEELAKAQGVVLPILERIAKDLGLVCFRDDAVSHEGSPDVVTLSLGGKVMVVDVKVHRRLHESLADPKETVHGIKVAYVWKGEQYFDERSAKKLSTLFSSLDADDRANDDDARKAREGTWSSVRNVLSELHEADERTAVDDGRVDWFAQLDMLVAAVEREFLPIESSDDPLSIPLPALLPDPASLYPLVLVSASPSALVHPSTTSFLSTIARTLTTASAAPESTDPTRLRQFLNLRGVCSARFDFPQPLVVAPSPSPPPAPTLSSSSAGTVVGSSSEVPLSAKKIEREWCKVRITTSALKRGGIPMTRATGKRVCEALVGPPSNSTTSATEVKMNGVAAKHHHDDNDDELVVKNDYYLSRQRRSRGMSRTMAQLLLESESLLESETSTFHTISIKPPFTSEAPRISVPSAFRFQLVVDAEEEEALSLTSLWLSSSRNERLRGGDGGTTGDGLDEERSEAMKRLRRGVEVLGEQVRINDLVSSVINSDTRDSESSRNGDGDDDDDEDDQVAKERKRRKVERGDDDDVGMSLDELLSEAANTPRTLPVYIHAGASSTERPSIVLSFPSPHLPATQASPMSISIAPDPDSGGYTFSVKSKVDDVRKRLEDARERGQQVLRMTRDLGIFLAWVVKILVVL